MSNYDNSNMTKATVSDQTITVHRDGADDSVSLAGVDPEEAVAALLATPPADRSEGDS